MNESPHPTRLLITDRKISCPEENAARFVLHHGVPQGQDVGPFELDAGGWAVFVTAVETKETSDASRCNLMAEVSADTKDGIQPVAFSHTRLDPEGLVAGPFH
jgi:hypothetical protein